MSSHDDLPGRMSQTHDLNDLQRRVQREASCGTSSRFTSFVVLNQKIRSLPLRYLRHGFIALSIPAALVAGTVLPTAQPKMGIAPVAAAFAVQSGLAAYQGDGAVADEAADNEFVFSEGSSALGSPSNTPYAPVAVGVANLRQGPGTSFARVAKLSQGQTVRLLGRSKDWYKVQTRNGTTGWLHTEVVNCKDDRQQCKPARRSRHGPRGSYKAARRRQGRSAGAARRLVQGCNTEWYGWLGYR